MTDKIRHKDGRGKQYLSKDEVYELGYEAGYNAALQNTSSNNKYTASQASPKSCLSCKYECTGHTNAMCTENEYCDYEPA